MKKISAAVALLLPFAAMAQSAAPVQDWSNIETVTVVAPKGPAVWHVSRDGADIWFIATVTALPGGLDWNKDQITGIITGARHVYLQPGITAGLLETSWFLLTGMHKIRQPDEQTLLGSLPPDLRARYSAWLTKLELPPDNNENYLSAAAALDLEGDFRKHEHLDGKEAGDRIESIASHAGVDANPVAVYEAMPIIDEISSLPPKAEAECMRDALDDIDTQSVHANAAAHAWAVGDIAGIKANYSEARLYSCFDQTRTFASYRQRVIDDTMKAVQESLTNPGKSVFVVSIGSLLRKGGLLDRLAATGLKIDGPPV